jgi:hypothetical protein
MTPGARTPEELETLLEDAYLLGDGEVLAGLFEPSAVVAAADQGELRALQARNTALLIASHGIKVARRGDDGAWRYAISLSWKRETTTKGMQDDEGNE